MCTHRHPSLLNSLKIQKYINKITPLKSSCPPINIMLKIVIILIIIVIYKSCYFFLGNDEQTVCGMCGMLLDCSYPIGVKMI